MISKTTFETRYCQELWNKYMGLGESCGVCENISFKDYIEVQYDVYSYLMSVGREYYI
jgi:hypothetical protein